MRNIETGTIMTVQGKDMMDEGMSPPFLEIIVGLAIKLYKRRRLLCPTLFRLDPAISIGIRANQISLEASPS